MGTERVNRFLREERGATAVEYAFILAVIMLGIFGSIQTFGGNSGNLMGQNSNIVTTTVNNAISGS